MSYCLLMCGETIMDGDTVSAYYKNNNINLTKKVTSEKDSIKIKISNIDMKLQTFYMSVAKLGIETTIGITKDSELSIIEADKVSDPNILFKLKGRK